MHGIGVTEWLTENTPATIAEFLGAVTVLGDPVVVIVLLILLGSIVERSGGIDRDEKVGLAAAVVGSIVIVTILKVAFEFQRPDPSFGGFGLPSGHTAGAVALFGGLAWYLDDEPTIGRVALVGVAVLVAVSRLVIGAHFLLDVVVGAAIAVGLLVLVR